MDILYSASQEQFFQDLLYNRFSDKMEEAASKLNIAPSFSERISWQNNAPHIKNILELAHTPSETYVAFECKVPNGNKRIDCMLYGRGANGTSNVIHIELKQWSNATVSELYDNGVFSVEALTGKAYRKVSHPCQQVQGYQRHLLNFVPLFSEQDYSLTGLSYCYNYKKEKLPLALYAQHYSCILQQYPLYAGDEVIQLAEKLSFLLKQGDGLSIFSSVQNSPVRPSKYLLNAVSNIFQGITEFVLLDDQITASNSIFAEIQACSKEEKAVIIVKGGPGTGKTLIALHILAQLAAQQKKRALYTTRSTSLRTLLQRKLAHIGASELIANIFTFKPAHYKESELDVLFVDEAHRIQSSANFMTDKKYETTYLSQVMSLIYCAKVAVFFIDDKQAIKKTEIGTSISIRKAAENYASRLTSEKEPFLQKIEQQKQRLAKKQADPSTPKKELDELRSQIQKEACIHQVKSTFPKVHIVELELKSQFRCNGSDNYLDWLDTVLYKSGKEREIRFGDYDFQIFQSPRALYDKIRALQGEAEKPIARLVAGYCWKWTTKALPHGDLARDVVIGDDFAEPWETNTGKPFGEYKSKYASSAETWAEEAAGINQIGCVFSIQGIELDYIGVIIGPDLDYDPTTDALVAVPKQNIDCKSSHNEHYDQHIKNIYRVLMSRGKKGCYIYSCNPAVSDFLARQSERKSRL